LKVLFGAVTGQKKRLGEGQQNQALKVFDDLGE
jgi:hypothetical protein